MSGIVQLGVAVVDQVHLRIALAGLTAMNRALLKLYRDVPPLYSSGVRYRGEKPDRWETLDLVLARGYGDCEDLSAWRAAELQEQGVNAHADVYNVRANKWHAVVYYPDGTMEDPSRQLGMASYFRRRRAHG